MNWISVEERLPDKKEYFYLVYYANCCISKALFSNNRFYGVEDGWADEHPSHWMPLPKPPEDK